MRYILVGIEMAKKKKSDAWGWAGGGYKNERWSK